jgi:hypothetical protein
MKNLKISKPKVKKSKQLVYCSDPELDLSKITKEDIAFMIQNKADRLEAIAYLEVNKEKFKEQYPNSACCMEDFVIEEVKRGTAFVIPTKEAIEIYKAQNIELIFPHPIIVCFAHTFLQIESQEGLIRTANNPNPNRDPKNNPPKQFGYTMTYGLWFVTSETIKFDENGFPGDGQNRFTGANDSNKVFTSSYAYGLPVKAILACDNGTPKTTEDLLTMIKIDTPKIAGKVILNLHRLKYKNSNRNKADKVLINFAFEHNPYLGKFFTPMYKWLDTMFDKKNKNKFDWTRTLLKRDHCITFLWAIHEMDLDLNLGKELVKYLLGVIPSTSYTPFIEAEEVINGFYSKLQYLRDIAIGNAKKSKSNPKVEALRDQDVLNVMLNSFLNVKYNIKYPILYGEALNTQYGLSTLIFPEDIYPIPTQVEEVSDTEVNIKKVA